MIEEKQEINKAKEPSTRLKIKLIFLLLFLIIWLFLYFFFKKNNLGQHYMPKKIYTIYTLIEQITKDLKSSNINWKYIINYELILEKKDFIKSIMSDTVDSLKLTIDLNKNKEVFDLLNSLQEITEVNYDLVPNLCKQLKINCSPVVNLFYETEYEIIIDFLNNKEKEEIEKIISNLNNEITKEETISNLNKEIDISFNKKIDILWSKLEVNKIEIEYDEIHKKLTYDEIYKKLKNQIKLSEDNDPLLEIFVDIRKNYKRRYNYLLNKLKNRKNTEPFLIAFTHSLKEEQEKIKDQCNKLHNMIIKNNEYELYCKIKIGKDFYYIKLHEFQLLLRMIYQYQEVCISVNNNNSLLIEDISKREIRKTEKQKYDMSIEYDKYAKPVINQYKWNNVDINIKTTLGDIKILRYIYLFELEYKNDESFNFNFLENNNFLLYEI